MPYVELTGLSGVLKNLNSAIAGIKGRTEGGVLKAALLVDRRSGEKTPVRFGILKASRSTQLIQGGNEPQAAVSYKAAYAPFVHENLEAHHNVGEAKFLEHAVNESTGDIVRIIGEEARVS